MIAWDQVDENVSDKESVVLVVQLLVSLLITVNSLIVRFITFVASGLLYFILFYTILQ